MCVLCTVVGLLFKEVGGIETGIWKTENSGREEERGPACFKVEASKMLALKGFLSIFRKPSRLVVPPTSRWCIRNTFPRSLPFCRFFCFLFFFFFFFRHFFEPSVHELRAYRVHCSSWDIAPPIFISWDEFAKLLESNWNRIVREWSDNRFRISKRGDE